MLPRSLETRHLRDLRRFLDEQRAIAATDLEARLAHLASFVERHLGGYGPFVVLVEKCDEPSYQQVAGYRVAHLRLLGDDAEKNLAIWREYVASEGYRDDAFTQAFMAGAGQCRALSFRDFTRRHPSRHSPTASLLREQDCVDRLSVALPFPDGEVSLSCDRERGARAFSECEQELLMCVMSSLFDLGRYFSLSFGRGARRLTPREREALIGLLRGLPEPEIAETMGLRPGSLHQYVVSIFRKLGVTSRSELMSLWLGFTPTPRAREKR